MKTKNTILAAAFGISLLSVAGADTVYLTGSSAFRSKVHAQLKLLYPSATYAYDGSADKGFDKATRTIIKTASHTILCTWTGSVGGIKDLGGDSANPNGFDVAFLDPANTTTSAGAGTYIATSSEVTITAKPQIAFSDVYQGSTNWNYTPLTDDIVVVLPFKWLAGYGAPAGLANMTPQLAQALFSNGKLPTALWTGSSADRTSSVYALGRNDESGTRLTAMAETGVGALSGITQYQPTSDVSNNVTGYTNVGNSGYESGGDLATSMRKTSSSGVGFNVSYVGVSDAASAKAAADASGNPAKELTYNGVTFSKEAVIDGSYTFWCYEHLYTRDDVSGEAVNTATNLVTGLQGIATASDGSNIKLTDMKVSRITDGSQVGADYLAP